MVLCCYDAGELLESPDRRLEGRAEETTSAARAKREQSAGQGTRPVPQKVGPARPRPQRGQPAVGGSYLVSHFLLVFDFFRTKSAVYTDASPMPLTETVR